MLGWIVLLVAVGFLAYIRFGPTDAARWHQPVDAQQDEDRTGGAVRVIAGNSDTLARLDSAARQLPRTDVIAGSVAEGRITYRTRSLIFGFPDYTTIELNDGQIRMFARLRFGTSDMGVNRNRLQGLIAQVQS